MGILIHDRTSSTQPKSIPTFNMCRVILHRPWICEHWPHTPYIQADGQNSQPKDEIPKLGEVKKGRKILQDAVLQDQGEGL